MDKGKKKQPMESVDLEEEHGTRVEDVNVDEAKLILRLPPYIPLRNPTVKVTKDLMQ